MQNALRAKLVELQNSRRINEEKEEQKERQKAAPSQKLDFSLFKELEDFGDRSWVEIIAEEEEKQREKAENATTTASAVVSVAPVVVAAASSTTADVASSSVSNKRRNSQRTETEEEAAANATKEKQQKFDFSLFDELENFGDRSWVEIIAEEEEKQRKNALMATVAVSVVSSSAPNKRRHILPNPQEGWVEPNTGWCRDEPTLVRRDKELKKMKEKPIYKRYLSEIPKFARDKKIHPRTPNKFINHTRRSWDKQVRIWKLAIYQWAGETPTSSVCGSRSPSVCSESSGEMSPSQKKVRTVSIESSSSYNNNNNDADNVASIMGHFDLDTLRGGGEESTLVGCGVGMGGCAVGDESTMKPIVAAPSATASATGVAAVKTVRGPTDFSDLVVPKREKVPSEENGGDEGEWVEVKKRPKLEAKKRGALTKK